MCYYAILKNSYTLFQRFMTRACRHALFLHVGRVDMPCFYPMDYMSLELLFIVKQTAIDSYLADVSQKLICSDILLTEYRLFT